LLITFLSFGFSKSALNYQKKLTEDPFSNWINLIDNGSTRKALRLLETDTQLDSLRQLFGIKNTYFYSRWQWKVKSRQGDTSLAAIQCRSIEPSTGVINALMHPNNLIRKYIPDTISNDSIFWFEPNGIVVTQKLLQSLGLDDTTVVFLPIRTFNNADWLPFPIIAVVKEMPDLSDIVCTNTLYTKSSYSLYDSKNTKFRFFIENAKRSDIDSLLIKVYTALDRLDYLGSIYFDSTLRKDAKLKNWLWTVENEGPYLSFHEKMQRLNSIPELNNFHWGQYWELTPDTTFDNAAQIHDCLAIEFQNLDKIREFANYILEKYELPLNMEVLKQRENYLFTSKLALGAIFMVLLLSIVSVTIYISGSIRNHLEKVKKNLGNFLAFGINNKVLIWLYIRVTLRILLTALLPAFLVAWTAGEIFERYFLTHLLILEAGENYFSLINAWFLLFIATILFIAISRTFFSISLILKHTPGDLVYERDGKH
jgi:hypothetical protein